MRIGMDLRFTTALCMGTGSYAETAALSLASALHSDDILVGYTEDEVGTSPLAEVVSQRLLSPRFAGTDSILGQRLMFDAAIDRDHLDVFVAVAGIGPLVASCPVVVTIHDLLFDQHPEFFGPALQTYLSTEIPRSIRAANRVIAVSTATKRAVHERFHLPDDRIQVIHQPLRALFRQPPTPDQITTATTALNITQPYLVTLTNHAPHKNTAFALEVFAAWIRSTGNTTHQLVIAGGGMSPQKPVDLQALADRMGIAQRIVITGRVSDKHLPGLLAGATLFLYPSLHEGWGLPPLEAMAAGTPVLVSDRGGLPEAVGDAGMIAPLGNHGQWVAAIHSVVSTGVPESLTRAMSARVSDLQKPGGEAIRDCLVQAIEYAHTQGAHNRHRPQATSKVTSARSGDVSSSDRLMPDPSCRNVPAAPSPIDVPSTQRISGCTIIRNGVRLAYPFVESVTSYAPLCHEIIVCWDPTSDDATNKLVERVAAQFPQVRLVESAWDLSNRTGGSELARQTQIAFAACSCPWTLYVQADEAIHERSFPELKNLIQDPDIIGIGFERRSFLGDLGQDIIQHRVTGLTRLFRTGLGTSVGDAMQVSLPADRGRVCLSHALMCNYSRLGNDDEIANRVVNLHAFYHTDVELASIDRMEHRHLETAPYVDSHPAPIESRFRNKGMTAPKRPTPKARTTTRIAVNIIARETDAFGAMLFASCLDSLQGYADDIVIVDHGLGEDAHAAITERRQSLPISIHDGRSLRQFGALRNLALQKTPAGIDYVHKIDTDEVYYPQGLFETKSLLSKDGPEQVNATFVHFLIDPMLVESIQTKEVLFRFRPDLTWTGSVHEKPKSSHPNQGIGGPCRFLHFGYCRPQWQIFLKWLHYAKLESGSLAPYQWEFVDGVRLPWCRGDRTPDTVLDQRRRQLTRFTDPYPPSVRPWLEHFAQSRLSWRDWIASQTDQGIWREWQELACIQESWPDTIPTIYDRVYAASTPSTAAYASNAAR